MDQQSPRTRLSLLTRLKNAADHETWSEFTAIYEPLILRLLERDGLQEPDARDVCQQVLAAVAKDIEQWRPDGRDRSFRRWLFRIARNRVIKFLEGERKSKRGSDSSNSVKLYPYHACRPQEITLFFLVSVAQAARLASSNTRRDDVCVLRDWSGP